jgi:rhodanese-related sulfurtransferase
VFLGGERLGALWSAGARPGSGGCEFVGGTKHWPASGSTTWQNALSQSRTGKAPDRRDKEPQAAAMAANSDPEPPAAVACGLNIGPIRVGTMFGDQVPTVLPGEVAARVAEGWMLLDVRTDDEWADGRIAGSVHIPMDQLMQRLDEVEDRVVCVCAVGARSARVAQFLNAQGRDAVNLEGGLYAWANSGHQIES